MRFVSTIVNAIIDIFEAQKGLKSEDAVKADLTKAMSHFLDEEGDLQYAIKQAYRSYMDAEAPDAWVAVTERKLKAYCDLA